MATQRAIRPTALFVATAAKGEVSGPLWRPDDARWLLVFGHGAGAGMRHRFMHEMSACLAAAGIATLRYQFPYMEAGSRRPDARPICSLRYAPPSMPPAGPIPTSRCSPAANPWAGA